MGVRGSAPTDGRLQAAPQRRGVSVVLLLLLLLALAPVVSCWRTHTDMGLKLRHVGVGQGQLDACNSTDVQPINSVVAAQALMQL
jgi:hypothetical protein